MLAVLTGMVVVLVLVLCSLPLFPMCTTGTSTGAPQIYPYKWSVVGYARVQYRYARALRLSPRMLMRAMSIAIPPGSGETPEDDAIARRVLSSRTTGLFRWRESLHAPATYLARRINECRPRLLTIYPSALAQLTRLKRRDIVKWTPEVIVTFGEYVSDDEWAETRKVWAPARVEQFYGASECPLIAVRDDDGCYRTVSGSQVRPVEGGVMVWGFPLYKWTLLKDDVQCLADGRLAIGNSRQYPHDDMVDRGLAAIRAGDIDAFQIQLTGNSHYRVAYVTSHRTFPQQVAAIFNVTYAMRGEPYFRTGFGSDIKQASFVDLRKRHN